MMKFFKKRLRKSHSVHDETRHKVEDNLSAPGSSQHTRNANGGLAQSRTFDASHGLRTQDYHSFVTEAGSSSMTDDRNEALLDRGMMQTITDVKYVKRRPKFTAVSSANFQREFLEANNYVRIRYGMPQLIWSQELAELAKTWAMKLAERGRILYPELPDVGENIYLESESHENHLTTGQEMVAFWGNQANDFDFEKPRWSIKTKDFSQMIWRASIELGVCRYWNMTKNCLCIVAFYRPSGNANGPGEFAANIPTKGSLPKDIKELTNLNSLIQTLTRTVTITDAGFTR